MILFKQAIIIDFANEESGINEVSDTLKKVYFFLLKANQILLSPFIDC